MNTDVNYHNRIDFRPWDVLAEAIIKATPAELEAAIESAREIGNGETFKIERRLLFRAFANTMSLYKRKYGFRGLANRERAQDDA